MSTRYDVQIIYGFACDNPVARDRKTGTPTYLADWLLEHHPDLEQWNAGKSNIMAAESMTPEWHQRLADNVGQRVRLTRVVTYEGDNTAVLQTVAASLQPGKSYGGGTYTVSVREAGYGRVEDLEQPRIVVAHLDPDTLVGIAPCDDGDGGWVVMQQDGEGNAEPVGDEHGQIVYVDILDAAEVLKTGIVWKHDMGDGEADEDQP